jgi:hypothetical protein
MRYVRSQGLVTDIVCYTSSRSAVKSNTKVAHIAVCVILGVLAVFKAVSVSGVSYSSQGGPGI